MLADLGIILYWWLVIFGLGTLFLPLTKKVFAKFYDQGYLFSKVFGFLIPSYLTWLLGSLKILAFNNFGLYLTVSLGLILNLFIFLKEKSVKNLKTYFKPIFLIEELLFLFALIVWSFVRGFQPDIQGLEKFMDFGFVNSILRSRFFPPTDIWFSGQSINYYYFGHLVTAFLTKLSQLDSAVTYNLMIASLFAFCFSLTFSLTSNLTYLFFKEKPKKNPWGMIIFSGLVSGLVICLGANLHPGFYNFKMKILQKPYCDGSLTYWYPNATRYIGYCPDVNDKTIHEFPAYSFIVSDLHGHVSDLPFVFTFLGLALVLFLKIKEVKKPFYSLAFEGVLIALILAVMFMTNQWDFPVYLLVLGSILLVGFGQKTHWEIKKTIPAVLFGLLIILVSILFFLPFQLQFNPIVEGIGIVKAHSLFYQLIILWGIFGFFGLSFLVFLLQKKTKLKDSSELDLFVLILLAVATVLIIIPEIIYVKDIYIASYHRANTMFKLTYQAFVLFSISLGFIFVRVVSSLKKGFFYYFLLFSYTLLVCLSLIYPNYSLIGYYGKLKPKYYKGLYGLNFLKKISSGDYELVGWLNKNIEGQPVVLEAAGDSYTSYERISMATGLPTIEGWLVHEWLWRGSYDQPGQRSEQVRTIYESDNINQVKQLLGMYQVKYVVIGEMEREKYPNLKEEKFNSIGDKVFESKETKLFRINSKVD